MGGAGLKEVCMLNVPMVEWPIHGALVLVDCQTLGPVPSTSPQCPRNCQWPPHQGRKENLVRLQMPQGCGKRLLSLVLLL